MLKADSAIAYHDTPNLSLTVRPYSSGEPDAGKPPVRFGGRGDFNAVVPTPIYHLVPSGQQTSPTPVHLFDSTSRNRGRARARLVSTNTIVRLQPNLDESDSHKAQGPCVDALPMIVLVVCSRV